MTCLVPALDNRSCNSKKFPYSRVAEMWGKGTTIAQIGRAIKRVDKDDPNGDRYHSLRNFLYRMHKRGYEDGNGRTVRLPYRVPARTVRAARKAGLRAWSHDNARDTGVSICCPHRLSENSPRHDIAQTRRSH